MRFQRALEIITPASIAAITMGLFVKFQGQISKEAPLNILFY